MLALLAYPAAGLGQASVTFTVVALDGSHLLQAEPTGLRLRSTADLAGASLAGAGEHVMLTTVNYTTSGAVVAGTEPTRDGDSKPYDVFTLAAQAASGSLDVVIVPIPGEPAPRLSVRSSTSQLQQSQARILTETAYVDNTRPVYSADVSTSSQSASKAVASLRLEGSFLVSIWSWNFTVESQGSRQEVVTGSWRTILAADPALGQTILYQEFAQVAQLEIRNGWLSLENLLGADLAAYAPRLEVTGSGTAQVENARIADGDHSGLELDDSSMLLTGEYELAIRGGATGALLDVESLVGSLDVDGTAVALGRGGPLRSSTVQRDTAGNAAWAWPLALIALMGFAVIVKGPATTARFNRLEMRFEARDYKAVLARIAPFTVKRKYKRRANFLKAISLLSLGDNREATLFLETLSASDGPDPATKAFLQACAAAHRGDDAATLRHLTACFLLEPDYKDEAAVVPALKVYLPYFDNGEAPA